MWLCMPHVMPGILPSAPMIIQVHFRQNSYQAKVTFVVALNQMFTLDEICVLTGHIRIKAQIVISQVNYIFYLRCNALCITGHIRVKTHIIIAQVNQIFFLRSNDLCFTGHIRVKIQIIISQVNQNFT